MATINEALKKLFLGLGGDPDELKDNNTVSDYIDDLESAIETAASGASAELIYDEEASTTKTYSSTKIESLIPENELPTPAVGDIGKVVSVVSDGDEGAEYSLETPSGGGNSKYCFSATSTSGSLSVTMASGVTRESLQLTGATDIDLNLSAYVYYFDMDPQTYVTVSLSGYLSLKNYTIKSTSDNIGFPVFDGVLYDINKPTDLYQVVFILGATVADDRLEVIKLTTT